MIKDAIALLQYQTPRWKCKIAPQFELHSVGAPNWFHRKMQRLILGFKWEKL